MSMLVIDDVAAGYGNLEVLHGVSLTVGEGELVALIGANGAGKSTLLRTVSGLIRPSRGTITVDGVPITGASSTRIAANGVVHVPENRRVFPASTVEENLRLGAYPLGRAGRRRAGATMELVFAQFPRLAERRGQLAGSMSGGEQQMLAIGMGLMARPRVLMLDEPSLGLAPIVVERIFAEIALVTQSGTTVLLVEQLAAVALGIADRGVVLQHGRVVTEGAPEQLRSDPAVRAAYLGTG